MDIWLVCTILFGLLFVLLAAGLEIAVVLGLIALVSLGIFINYPLIQFGRLSWHLINSFVLTAVPLFIFMGELIWRSGVATSLFSGAMKWIGKLPGGLASATIMACALFSAVCGSSVATAATIGSSALPEMEKHGYSPTLAYGVVASGGTLGILIPPSITMIIYGSWVDVNVVKLFAAGILPGLALSFLFVATIMIWVILRPQIAPKAPGASWRERGGALFSMLPWLIIILAVLGSIFGGIATPTEGAAVGASAALIMSVAYRRLTFKVVKESALSTVVTTSMIMFIMCGARVMAFFFQQQGIGKLIVELALASSVSKYNVLFMICILYGILGCFFDPVSMLVLTLPLVIPVVTYFGFDLVWFGVYVTILIEMSHITPPVGLNLFVVQGLRKGAQLMTIAWGCCPFLISMVILLILLAIFPEIALWLPPKIIG